MRPNPLATQFCQQLQVKHEERMKSDVLRLQSLWDRMFFWKKVPDHIPVEPKRVRLLNPLVVRETAFHLLNYSAPTWDLFLLNKVTLTLLAVHTSSPKTLNISPNNNNNNSGNNDNGDNNGTHNNNNKNDNNNNSNNNNNNDNTSNNYNNNNSKKFNNSNIITILTIIVVIILL